MVKVKEMPYSEKYAKVMDSIKLDEEFMPAFVREHLGDGDLPVVVLVHLHAEPALGGELGLDLGLALGGIAVALGLAAGDDTRGARQQQGRGED